jgi:hypothetical protein
VLVDAATGQPPVGGQAVNPLPFIGDQTGGTVAIPSGSASGATALPGSATRISMFADTPCTIRLGNGSVAATASSFPLAANTPYEFQLRAGETYVSVWGLSGIGTLRWGRLDAS